MTRISHVFDLSNHTLHSVGYIFPVIRRACPPHRIPRLVLWPTNRIRIASSQPSTLAPSHPHATCSGHPDTHHAESRSQRLRGAPCTWQHGDVIASMAVREVDVLRSLVPGAGDRLHPDDLSRARRQPCWRAQSYRCHLQVRRRRGMPSRRRRSGPRHSRGDVRFRRHRSHEGG